MKIIKAEQIVKRPSFIINEHLIINKMYVTPVIFTSLLNPNEVVCNNNNVIIQWIKNPAEAWELFNASIMLDDYEQKRYIATYSRFNRLCGNQLKQKISNKRSWLQWLRGEKMYLRYKLDLKILHFEQFSSIH